MKKNFKNLKLIDLLERFNLLFHKIKGVKLTNFQIIFSSYAVIFSIFLLLSLPGLFNYEKYVQEIKNKILLDYKIHLENITDVKYRFIPSPHILIGKADLKISKNSEKNLANLENIKLFISLLEIYKNKKIKTKKIIFNKANFYIRNNDFILFNDHLNSKIIKPIQITNSNFFYVNNNDDVATISRIDKFNYFIDFTNKEKELRLKGKIFDVNYNFNWKKNYNIPNKTQTKINFTNPNIDFENQILKNLNQDKFIGISKVNFLNNKFDLNYKIGEKKIFIVNKKKNNELFERIDLTGNLDLNPFYFNLNLILRDIDIKLLNQQIFSFFYPISNSINQNLNGNFKISLKSKKNKLFDNYNFHFLFKEGKIKLIKCNLNLKKIGNIEFSDFIFIEKLDKLFLQAKSELIIENQIQFYRRFQISKDDRINLKKIYFDIETNVDDNEFYLYNFTLNSSKEIINTNIDKKNINLKEVKNIQQLTKIIRQSFQKN